MIIGYSCRFDLQCLREAVYGFKIEKFLDVYI